MYILLEKSVCLVLLLLKESIGRWPKQTRVMWSWNYINSYNKQYPWG